MIVGLLASGKFPTGSTQHLLLECAINFAKSEDDIEFVRQWYTSGVFTNLSG